MCIRDRNGCKAVLERNKLGQRAYAYSGNRATEDAQATGNGVDVVRHPPQGRARIADALRVATEGQYSYELVNYRRDGSTPKNWTLELILAYWRTKPIDTGPRYGYTTPHWTGWAPPESWAIGW